jgi:all-trans-8'-apo-beta-carotenal 15,15'-oxygenase
MTLATPSSAASNAGFVPSSSPAADRAPVPENALGAFTDLTAEHGFEAMRVEGAVPAELRGTLYRNGPARFSSFGKVYGHWFDGDGALSAVRFADGKALGAARFIATRGLVEERRQGRALYAGFGTRSPRNIVTRFLTSEQRGLARFVDGKNVANTSVMWDGERLLALWEGGQPTEIDPRDLTTRGETDLDGTVLQTFSAHPHRVASRRTTYNHGVRHGRTDVLDIYAKVDGSGWKVAGSLPLPWATMLHDIAYTERHVIAFCAPIKVRLFRMLLGLETVSDAIRFVPELGTEIVIAPLDDLTKVTRIQADASFFWHVANAYETPEGAVVDTVLYDDFDNNRYLASIHTGHPSGELYGRLSRTHLDFAKKTARSEEIAAMPGEFPIVSPSVASRPHRHVYMAAHASRAASGRDLHDRLVEVDVESGAVRTLVLGAGLYPGEPIFVPRDGAGERSGYLLTLVYDARAHRSHVAVIDAERFEDGPIARAHFEHHVPFGFHGTWAPAS